MFYRTKIRNAKDNVKKFAFLHESFTMREKIQILSLKPYLNYLPKKKMFRKIFGFLSG